MKMTDYQRGRMDERRMLIGDGKVQKYYKNVYSDKLGSYRNEHNLSQAQLANKIGVSKALLGMIETGRTKDVLLSTKIAIEYELGIVEDQEIDLKKEQNRL